MRAPPDPLSEQMSEPSEGFAIILPAAHLADLIQINCLNRVRGVFRVSSGPLQGHLFFSGGMLIHADFGEEAVGLDAVVQMLGLRGGSITPCVRTWPQVASIDMGADALLLNAAQRIDEGERGRAELTTKVVRRALPAGTGPRPEPETIDIEPELEPEVDAELDAELEPFELFELTSEPVGLAAPLPGRPRELGGLPASEPAERLVRLAVAQVGLDGSIQKLTPGANPELADTAFFCQRVAALIGEELGLGECCALSFEAEAEGIVVFQGRNLVATRGKLRDLEFVREKVGLVGGTRSPRRVSPDRGTGDS
jgi:hypothetical protein